MLDRKNFYINGKWIVSKNPKETMEIESIGTYNIVQSAMRSQSFTNDLRLAFSLGL